MMTSENAHKRDLLLIKNKSYYMRKTMILKFSLVILSTYVLESRDIGGHIFRYFVSSSFLLKMLTSCTSVELFRFGRLSVYC